MTWDELSEARKRVVYQALDVMREHASQVSSEDVGCSQDARAARETIEAAIEKLQEGSQ
jgi:hypothetical protein